MKLELLYAKDAVFKLIAQFNHAINLFDDKDKLYIYNYSESALEAAFNVLGIEEDYIPLRDFCQMWEDNSRKIWEINAPDKPFNGITADVHYEIFKDDYENFLKRRIEEFLEYENN